MISRRGILTSLLAAPVVIRTPGLLMPVKAVVADVVLKWQIEMDWNGRRFRVLAPGINVPPGSLRDVEWICFEQIGPCAFPYDVI